MTEKQARTFVKRARREPDVCVSYAYDADGRILFAAARRESLTRLPVVAGVAAALAACSPKSSAPQADGKALASASASARSAASTDDCADTAHDQAAREAELAKSLPNAADAADAATRARLEAELKRGPRMTAGKLRPPPSRSGCKCDPGDPLCSCAGR